MNNNSGNLVSLLFTAILMIALIGIMFFVSSIIAAAAATGGVLWGGGVAIKNYVQSFKENMIES
ncbi:MAG TPA: hypothetical protein IAA29_14580 [Candidatus Paenibacillus intestinavium]|nr:hypothetical protein [Candidatus Paenibacillus intestinavium]